MRVAVSLLGALLALAACVKEESGAQTLRSVLVRTVRLGSADSLNVYSGEVRAHVEAELGFRVSGKMVERRVKLGDTVRRGQILARLDPQDIALSASAAHAQVSAAEADLKLAGVEYERVKQLAIRDFVSASVVDQRHTALLAAQSRLKQAQAQASVASNQTGYANLIADGDGKVTAVLAEAGQIIAAGQPVMRLTRGDGTEVQIYVPEKRIAAVKLGAQVMVRPWTDPNVALLGKVTEVGAAADSATRTFPVRVAVQGAGLALGATAAVVFPGAAAARVVLPNGAVIARDGGSAVWIVGRDGRLSLRRVDVAALREDGVVISRGLADGDQVAVVGAHTLAAGMKVKAQAEATPVSLDPAR